MGAAPPQVDAVDHRLGPAGHEDGHRRDHHVDLAAVVPQGVLGAGKGDGRGPDAVDAAQGVAPETVIGSRRFCFLPIFETGSRRMIWGTS